MNTWLQPAMQTRDMIAIVDASPLLAAAYEKDPNHRRCRQLLESRELDLVVPALVVAEVAYFLDRLYGPSAEAAFLRGLEDLDVEAPLQEEWPAIADFVERYGNFPLGTVDASIIAVADRLGTDLVVTLDYRHFRAVRKSDGRPFRLLPE